MITTPTEEQYIEVARMARNFQDHSEHVKVDPLYTAKMYADLIYRGDAAVFVLVKDEKIVGGIGCIKSPDLHYPRMIAVETFWFVLPEYRGEGLQLFDRFEEWAKESGCDCAAMIHLSDSYPEALKRLYKKKGYFLTENHYVKVLK